MKELFEMPVVELIVLDNEDVITTSDELGVFVPYDEEEV